MATNDINIKFQEINDDEIDDHCLIYEEFKKEKKIQNNSVSYVGNNIPNIQIRTFNSGATRDSNEGKLEYARFNCPLVFKRVAEYMHLHRKQSDGTLRDPDNWKNLFGENHEDICMDSLLRHTTDVWLINKGFSKEAKEDLESALSAIIMNSTFWLHKILKEKYNGTKS